MVAYGERRMDETPLVARALAGDEAAVAALYDRYADKLYDYARFLTGSSTDAGDITHDVFLVAMQRLSQLRDHAKFRPWVYAIMRTEVSRRRLRASRLHLGAWDDNSGEPVSSDLTPTRAAEIAELRQLIAAAADGLSDDDREVLDLHLRHGLSGAEMAAALEIPERHVSVTMQRLRGRLARGLGVVLVGRAPTCPEFVALRDREGEFSELARKRLARHIDGCVLCSADRDDRMRPEVLLGALPMALAPLALRGSTVPTAVKAVAGAGGLPAPAATTGVRWLHNGFPTLQAARKVSRLAIAALTGSATLTGGAVLVMRHQSTESSPFTIAVATSTGAASAAGGPGTPTTATSTDGAVGSASTSITVIGAGAPPGATITVDPVPGLGGAPTATNTSSPTAGTDSPAPASTISATAPPTTAATTSPATTTTATTAATTTTGAAPPDTTPPAVSGGQVVPFRISSQGPSGDGTCTTQITTGFSVVIDDDVAAVAATATWVAPGGAARTTSLSRIDSTWSGTIGPFPFAEIPVGDVVKYDVTVTTHDAAGNTTVQTFPQVGAVDSCPLV